MGNPITWFDIVEPDPVRTATFYTELFGWHMQHLPGWNYHLIDTRGRTDTHSGNGINGGIGRAREGQPPGSVIYAENPDIQAVLDRAESLGARTTMQPTDVGGDTSIAVFEDRQGLPFGLFVHQH